MTMSFNETHAQRIILGAIFPHGPNLMVRSFEIIQAT